MGSLTYVDVFLRLGAAVRASMLGVLILIVDPAETWLKTRLSR